MLDNWQDIATAPRDELVLVCGSECVIQTAKLTKHPNDYTKKMEWCWRTSLDYTLRFEPKVWQPAPFPPKYLYERKLTADLLEKTALELRSK